VITHDKCSCFYPCTAFLIFTVTCSEKTVCRVNLVPVGDPSLYCWRQICLPLVAPVSVWRTVRAATSMKAGLSLWRWMAVFLCGHPWKDSSACYSLAHSAVTPEVAAVAPNECWKRQEWLNDTNLPRSGPQTTFDFPSWQELTTDIFGN